MKLNALIADLNPIHISGNTDVDVFQVRVDSRLIGRGDVFIAIRGTVSDGHAFIQNAVNAGASAVISEDPPNKFMPVTQIQVENSRQTLSRLASRVHGDPALKLQMIGVTGTNGKTTTTHVLASILEKAGIPCGLLGTLYYRIGNRELPAPSTTPGADQLHELLGQMVATGMKAAVMEVSSHALDQGRVDGVPWDVAVFTNLTQDHLDYHKSMEAYVSAKKRLFASLNPSLKKATAVLNADQPYSQEMRSAIPPGVDVLTYGIHTKADVTATSIEMTLEGGSFLMQSGDWSAQVRTQLCGLYNVHNILAAAAAARSLGLEWEAIRMGIETVPQIPGRMERIDGDTDSGHITVYVDYAHTDDALRRVLETLRPLTAGRLILVFGCGGDRDSGKRPLMGEVARECADHSIVTTDNPRYEEPAKIIADIVKGFGTHRNYETVLDRRQALEVALKKAEQGDVVLVAGKGHETYQETKGIKSPFDDRFEVRRILQERTPGNRGGGVHP